MCRITWKSGSLKAGKWAVGIGDGNEFEVAVIRGKTYQEAESRARLVIALLTSQHNRNASTAIGLVEGFRLQSDGK